MAKIPSVKHIINKHPNVYSMLIAYALIVICFLAVYLPFLTYVRNDFKQFYYDKLTNQCKSDAIGVDSSMDDTFTRLDTFGSIASQYENDLSSDKLSNILADYYTKKERVDGICVICHSEEEGYYIANNTSPNNHLMALDSYYDSVFSGTRNFRYDKDMFYFTAPIVNDEDEVIALIESYYTTEHCLSKLSFATTQNAGPTFIYRADTGLTVEVEHFDKIITPKYTAGNVLGDGLQNQFVSENIENKTPSFSIIDTINGKEFYLHYTILEEENYYVVKYIASDDIAKEYETYSRGFIIVGMAALFLTTAFFIFALYRARKSLRENEKKFSELKLLTESIPCAILSRKVDADYTIASFSEGFLKHTGYSSEEISQRFHNRFIDLIYENDKGLVSNSIHYQSEKTPDEDIEIEYRIVKKDGSLLWIRDRGMISVSETGEKFFYSVLLDITESRFANEQLASKTKDLKSIMQILPSGIIKILLNDSLDIDTANNSFYKLCGYTADEIRNVFNCGLLEIVDPRDREKLLDVFRSRGNNGESISVDFRIRRKAGKRIWVSTNAHKDENSDGETELLCVLTDITSLKDSYNQAKLDREKFRALSSMSSDIIFEYNINEDEMSFVGTGPLPLPPHVPDFTHSDFYNTILSKESTSKFDVFINQMKQSLNIENAEMVLVSPRSNNPHWFALYAYSITVGENLIALGKLVDIHQKKMEIEALKEANKRDPLTGLYNKSATKFCVDYFLEKEFAENSEHQHALMILDIDNFKSFNDRLGHITGDAVLVEISKEISSLFRSRDIIGRVGGDEFVLFIKDFPTKERMAQKAKEICEAFSGKSFGIGENAIDVSVSIGIALVGKDGLSYDELFEKADVALYKVKNSGKNNFSFFSPKA